jgi:phosphocarrier protein HPr
MEHQSAVTIVNKYGLHARPAAEFVKLANRFRAEVWIRKEDVEVSGKSIMGVMMLAAECGSSIVQVRATGDDAAGAVEALCELVRQPIRRGLTGCDASARESPPRRGS